MSSEAVGVPAHVYMMIAVFSVTFGYVIYNIIRYAPGEKQALKVERRRARHTRSHHYKLGER